MGRVPWLAGAFRRALPLLPHPATRRPRGAPSGATCLAGDLSRHRRGGDRPPGTGDARELGACAAQATSAAVGRPRGAAATWPAPPRGSVLVVGLPHSAERKKRKKQVPKTDSP